MKIDKVVDRMRALTFNSPVVEDLIKHFGEDKLQAYYENRVLACFQPAENGLKNEFFDKEYLREYD